MSNVTEVFAAMSEAVSDPKTGKALRKKFKGSVVFHVTDKNVSYSLDLSSASPSVKKGSIPSPDLQVTLNEAVLLELAHKKLKPQEAFMKGKLKIKGKMALAMKLNAVLASSRKYLPKSKL